MQEEEKEEASERAQGGERAGALWQRDLEQASARNTTTEAADATT